MFKECFKAGFGHAFGVILGMGAGLIVFEKVNEKFGVRKVEAKTE